MANASLNEKCKFRQKPIHPFHLGFSLLSRVLWPPPLLHRMIWMLPVERLAGWLSVRPSLAVLLLLVLVFSRFTEDELLHFPFHYTIDADFGGDRRIFMDSNRRRQRLRQFVLQNQFILYGHPLSRHHLVSSKIASWILPSPYSPVEKSYSVSHGFPRPLRPRCWWGSGSSLAREIYVDG